MFALSHVYISTKVTGRKSDLLVFGSVLPDIATTSKGELARDEIHYSPMKFFNFVKSKHGDLLDLAIGVRLHSNVNKGADFYSDDTKTGYAKLEGKKINADVSRLLGVGEDKISLGAAHNFIEGAVDLNLIDSHPHLLSIYKHSVEHCDLQKITECLSEYLKKDKNLILKEVKHFIDFLSPEHLSSPELMTKGIAVPLIDLRLGKKVDFQETLEILKKAESLTKETYLDFLNKTVRQMRIDFSGLTFHS